MNPMTSILTSIQEDSKQQYKIIIIEPVHGNETSVDKGILEETKSEPVADIDWNALSNRERTVLLRKLQGTENNEIANQLWMDEKVIEADVASIHQKKSKAQVRLNQVSNIDWSHLTEREDAVFRLILEGNENKEIAGILMISEKTVKNHVSSILSKLKVKNRTKAVVLAFQTHYAAIM
ncbi:LuxR C-terminal-related transcriptional regulator [Brevibacillus sp. AG]|uniref:helix-turn-helix domain-containing protein n=1 Tax=Brevibacillus sp. AG TaxID=3020891 RepID=UPI00232E50B3|nr:LuxR C-terminal-related transcriptional regulator [Brevibacillus sp. AG]MDC0764218.1 LuxR C-terminal-related transcriptional regulator [Brevibacillus sp. AG]